MYCQGGKIILKNSYWPLLVGFCAIICGGGYGFIVLKKAEKSTIGKTINYSFFDDNFTVNVSGGNSQIAYSSSCQILLRSFFLKQQYRDLEKNNLSHNICN